MADQPGELVTEDGDFVIRVGARQMLNRVYLTWSQLQQLVRDLPGAVAQHKIDRAAFLKKDLADKQQEVQDGLREMDGPAMPTWKRPTEQELRERHGALNFACPPPHFNFKAETEVGVYEVTSVLSVGKTGLEPRYAVWLNGVALERQLESQEAARLVIAKDVMAKGLAKREK